MACFLSPTQPPSSPATPTHTRQSVPTWTSTPFPAVTATLRTLAHQPTATRQGSAPPTNRAIPTDTLASPIQFITAPTRLEATQLFSVPADQVDIGWVAVNKTNIFWTPRLDLGAIYQYPLAGGAITTVVSTTFPGGTVDSYLHFFVNDEWLVYKDATDLGAGLPWRLLARNLHTRQALTIAENLDGTWSSPDFHFDGQQIVWTVLAYPQPNQPCAQIILMLYDLAQRQQRQLDQHCIEGSYILELPVISGHFIAAAKTFADLSADIEVWDLTTNTKIQVTANGHSSMPAIAYPWVAWKNAKRYENAHQTGLYNLQTGERRLLDLGTEVGEPGLYGQRWLTWSNQSVFKEPVYVYDLAQRKVHWLAQPHQQPNHDESIHGVTIFGSLIAWHRDNLIRTDQLTSIIEWTYLP